MRLPTVCEAELALRRLLNIVTPVAAYFVLLSIAFDVRGGWLQTAVFGTPGRYEVGVARMTCGAIAGFTAIIGLVICAIVACGGCEEARRKRPATWHGVIYLATFIMSTHLMAERLR